MAQKNVHGGHRKRLRDRAMQEGLSSFDPHQIVEMLLFHVIPRQDTSEIAHHLVDRFGSVDGVLHASETELMETPGVGKKAACWLASLGGLITAYGELCAEDRARISNYSTAIKLAESLRGRCIPPSTYQICTTPSGTIQSFSKICDSTEWGDSATLKGSVYEALSVKARSVIIVEYQENDKAVKDEYQLESAEKYARTLNKLGAELLDVILIARSESVSLSREGTYNKKEYGANVSILADNYMREEIDEIEYGEDLPVQEHGL